MRKAGNLPRYCAVVTTFENLKFSEPSGGLQGCYGELYCKLSIIPLYCKLLIIPLYCKLLIIPLHYKLLIIPLYYKLLIIPL